MNLEMNKENLGDLNARRKAGQHISIVSEFSGFGEQKESLVDFTLKSDGLEYSADETAKLCSPLSDTKQIMRHLRDHRGLDASVMQNEELEKALSEANETALQLKKDLEFVLTREEELRGEHADLKEKYGIIKKFFDAKDAELTELRETKSELQSRHTAKLDELTQQLAEEREATRRAELTVERMQEKLMADQEQRLGKVQSYTAEIAQLQTELEAEKTRREHFESQRERLSKRLGQVEREKQQMDQELSSLQRENVQLETKESTSGQKLQLLESQIRKLLEESQEERARTRKLKMLLKEKIQQRDERIERAEARLKAISVCEEEEAHSRSYECDQLRLDLQEAARQRAFVEEEAATLQRRSQSQQNELRRLELQLLETKRASKERDQQITELRRTNDELHAMNGRLLKRHQHPRELELQSFDQALQRRCKDLFHWKEVCVELFALAGAAPQDCEELMRRLGVSARFSDSLLSESSASSSQISSTVSFCRQRLGASGGGKQVDQLQALVKQQSRRYNDVYSRFRRQMGERRRLHNELLQLRGGAVRLMLRVRPQLPREQEAPLAGLHQASNIIRSGGQQFEFERVFASSERQDGIYEEISSLVTSAMDGFNVCIMCYGQTGSGKTYTLDGCAEFDVPGMKELALRQILRLTRVRSEGDYEYQLGMSVVEVYNQKVRDLLAPDLCGAVDLQNGEVIGRKIVGVDTLERALKVLRRARANRSVGVTDMNEYSSRSHELLTLHFKGVNKALRKQLRGRLNFLDLAGSERVSKTHAQGERLKEAMHINKSLSALGNVLQALALKAAHVPFRDSKLTHLLKESLEDKDAKTLMIMHISPGKADYPESMSTLKFANRIKKKGPPVGLTQPEEDRCLPYQAAKKKKKATIKRGASADLPLAVGHEPWARR